MSGRLRQCKYTVFVWVLLGPFLPHKDRFVGLHVMSSNLVETVVEPLNVNTDGPTATDHPPHPESKDVGPKKREKKETVELVREPGKSLLPFARVQKIIKADRVRHVICTS